MAAATTTPAALASLAVAATRPLLLPRAPAPPILLRLEPEPEPSALRVDGREPSPPPLVAVTTSAVITTSSSSSATVPPVREYPAEYSRYQIPETAADFTGLLSPSTAASKRKRPESSESDDQELAPGGHDGEGQTPGPPPTAESDGVRTASGPDRSALLAPVRRKCSSDFLRKGQWTPTEERLARLLIEAFEDGYLPIYTGIRLRGYLAVQLQCDPMRVSKKLCAGTIDGKRVPKNYGQKKFRLRKKQLWDRDEAGRILGALEKLTKDMWRETGMPPPPFLNLSSTRSLEDEPAPSVEATTASTPSSPVKKISPPANKSKKQKDGVVFPIIYLNLSKKAKHGVAGTHNGEGVHSTEYSSQSESDSSSTMEIRVDGESLQAAYDLLNLHHQCSSTSPSSVTLGRDDQRSPSQLSNPTTHEVNPFVGQRSGIIPILPAAVSTKPSILRHQA